MREDDYSVSGVLQGIVLMDFKITNVCRGASACLLDSTTGADASSSPKAW